MAPSERTFGVGRRTADRAVPPDVHHDSRRGKGGSLPARSRDADVHKLCFLHRARGLGFSVEECRALLTLYQDRNRASADVKSIARTHLERIELKIEELQSMRKTLGHLIHCCDGDDRPDCPILDDLAGLPAHQNENAA